MATLFILSQKAIADTNVSPNLDMKIISQVIEDYNEKLRPQEKELVNRVLETLDSFPEEYFLKIVKTYNNNEFKELYFLVEAVTVLNSIVNKKSDEVLEQELKETKFKTFKCALDDVKNSITSEVKSRINIQIHANFKNENFSQDDEIYIVAAIGVPLLNIAAQLLKLAIYTNLSNADGVRDLINFDFKYNTLGFRKENTKYCDVILNDDKSLTVKIFNNKQEISFQFVLNK